MKATPAPVEVPVLRKTTCWLLVLALALGPTLSAAAEDPGKPGTRLALEVADPATRAEARLAVHNLYLNCFAGPPYQADVILSTVGTEYEERGTSHFLPTLALAYDRSLSPRPEPEWMALWSLGEQGTSIWSNLRSLLPFGKRNHSVEPPGKKVRRLKQLQAGEVDWDDVDVPSPNLDAVDLGRATYSHLITTAVKKGLGYAGIYDPAQFLYRSWLFRRRDLRDRRFQQKWQALDWYVDAADSSSLRVPQESLAEIKFYLIRNLSTFAPWVSPSQFLELDWSYRTARRQRNISVSATLLMAANQIHLGYEELLGPVVNGTPSPVGGILYYDPALAPAPDQVQWDSPNLFDLRYDPFTDERVQAFARAHPGKRIPLAIYSYYAVLPRKPILLVDFFDPDNPRGRESAAVRMNLLRDLLLVGAPGLLYDTVYRPTAYLANKKAFTPLADRVPAMGVEEFRLLLRNRLLFGPDVGDALLQLVDKRELNPMMPSAPTERVNAELNYTRLRTNGGAGVCQAVAKVRRDLYQELSGRKPDRLTAAEREQLGIWLVQRRALLALERLLESDQAWPRVLQASAPLLAKLEQGKLAPRLHTDKVLLAFYQRVLEERTHPLPALPGDLSATQERLEALLARAYAAEGRSSEDLANDLAKIRQQVADAERQHEEVEAKKQQELFQRRVEESLDWLKTFQANQDLRFTSPWRVERAVEFLVGVPAAELANPQLEPVVTRYRERVDQALAGTQDLLARLLYEEPEVEATRQQCLALLARRGQGGLPVAARHPEPKPAAPSAPETD